MTCEHCFCIEQDVNKVPHKKCCMCGTRKAVPRVEYK